MNPAYLTILLVLLVSLLDGFSAKDDSCPSLFQRFCAKHSYCLPANSSCDIMAYYPTQDQINTIISLHNQYRNMVALGTQNLPTAANMLQMEWDPELAAVAQKYANQCRYKHDLANCRQVSNFNVGQNLALQTLTGGNTVPQPDWNFAVSIWFSEIKYFQGKDVYPFALPKGEKSYGHFSQLVWAKSFRVGCGYVLYKTGNEITTQVLTRMYVCNYGPAGNVYGESVWVKDQPCKACPINSCCGSSCGYGAADSGLCRRKGNEAPYYAPPPNIFYCGFRDEADCDNYIKGNSNWEILSTLGGNQLSIVLNGGDSSTINFKREIQPTQSQFCITLSYRKGPNVDGQPDAGLANEILTVMTTGYTHSQPLVSYNSPQRQQFSTYNLTLSWKEATMLALNFAVPTGKPPQFFDVDSILITDGPCQNK